MNGPEHYAEAERLLTRATIDMYGNRIIDVDERTMPTIAAAQVHATLSLAAATAEAAPDSEVYGPLVQRPLPENGPFEGAPATPGSPWGQVLR